MNPPVPIDISSRSPRIQELRVSFVCAETHSPLLPPAAPLTDQATYIQKFETAGKKPPVQNYYSHPWKEGHSSSFWQRYLETPKLGAVDGWAAWKKLVPLRHSVGVKAAADWLKGSISLAGYVYPLGQTLVINLMCTPGAGGYSLDEVAKLAVEIRRGEYQAQVGTQSKVKRTLSGLINLGLDRLRIMQNGQTLEPGLIRDQFSYFTVVRGTGVVLPEPVPNPPVDTAMQHILWALSSGSSTYDRDNLDAFEKLAIKLKKNSPRHHVLYGTDRGRTVWFPISFMDPVETSRHPLGVYHRNLVACSMQVESLCGFISVAGRLAENDRLPADTFPMARLVVGILNRLYSGASSTYKTRSVMYQITQGDFVKHMNAVRRVIGWKEGDFTPEKPKATTPVEGGAL